MSDLHEDDKNVLRILGLSRDEFIAILAVLAILVAAFLTFRGCTTADPILQDVSTTEDVVESASDSPLAESGQAEITKVRIAYRPNYVHFDGVGEDSEAVELYLNGELIGETQTTLAGKWSYELEDLPAGFYEVQAVHPAIDGSESATRVIHIVDDANDGQTVELLPAGVSLADARAKAGIGAAKGVNLRTPRLNGNVPLTGLTAGAIALSGTGSPDTRHILRVNGADVASTVSDAEGNWSFDFNQNQAGEYDLSVVAVEGDSEAASPLYSLGVAAAEVAEESGADEVESNPTAQPIPTNTPQVAEAEVSEEETEEPDESAASPTTVPAPEYVLTIDDVIAGENSDSPVTVSGEASPGTTVKLFIDGVMVHESVAGEDGSWSFSGMLPPGSHNLEAHLFANGSESADQVAAAEIDVAEARDIVMVNNGRNGLLRVRFGQDGTGSADSSMALSDGAPAVELILDASWSMTLPVDSNEEANRLSADDPNSRIAVAREALVELVENTLPEGAPVALRAFGNIEGNLSCRTDLMSTLQPLDRENLSATIQAINPQFDANTALGASLAQVRNDLANSERDKVVVLLTDGQETCGRDPGIVIETLAAEGTNVQVNIIGFAIQDDALKAQFEDWAEKGNGVYYDAFDADVLADALAQSMTVGYAITDSDGTISHRGVVSGRPVELEPGVYNIFNSNGDLIYENIVVTSSSVNELIAR